jgi:hypothetical protein
MFGSLRAGGFAAAFIALSATVVGAGPSLAWELPSQAATSPSFQTTAISPSQPEALQVALPVQSVPLTANTITVDPVSTPVDETLATIAPAVIEPAPVTKKERATLAQLVATHRASDVANRELECLAGAIYFESKGEPLPGQVAVGQVIVNRAKSGRFPTSYCGVVFPRSQFSFVRGRALPPIPRSSAHWKTAVAVAHIVDKDLHDAVAPKALFFHARYVSPGWKRMSKVATVGNHVFYR